MEVPRLRGHRLASNDTDNFNGYVQSLDDGCNLQSHPHPQQQHPRQDRSLQGQKQTDFSIMSDGNLESEKGSNDKRSMPSSKPLPQPAPFLPKGGAFLTHTSIKELVATVRQHPIPCMFAISLLLFMGVEYTLYMVPSSAPPYDVGFLLTRPLHDLLASDLMLNSFLAAVNTMFVGMQAAYILWTLMVEGRPRATIAALFMFTCRGTLGYATQLPLPQEFLGSGADFPVGNVSFFLFFSGHVAGAVIASLDMRRTGRNEMAWAFDALNVLQGLRLLASRGHYTIDLAVGAGAGFMFDILASKYEEMKQQHAGH